MLRTVMVGVVGPALVVLATAGPTPATEQRTCRGADATIVGTAGDDTLVGTRGADVIVGMRGNDKLLGLDGDDVLCGGPGGDDLVGGREDDRLYGGHDEHTKQKRRTVVTGDLLEGGPGDDRLSPGFEPWTGKVLIRRHNTVSFRHSTRPVTADLSTGVAHGEGSDVIGRGRWLQVEGSRHADRLLGSRIGEILDGGRGEDQSSGGGGRDVLLGHHGADELDGGAARDLVISTAGADTLTGGGGADWLFAGSRAPTTLLGGPGADYLARAITSGETGVIDGGPGHNLLELDPQLWFDSDPSATLDAGTGTAVVTAEGKTQTTTFVSVRNFFLWGVPWTFRGTQGEDAVQVLSGRLDAQGFGGDDFMLGAEGDDVLDGGDGTDAVWGGEGQNTCISAEIGSCTGYPWDAAAPRTHETTGDRPGLVATPHHRLVSGWTSGRNVMRSVR